MITGKSWQEHSEPQELLSSLRNHYAAEGSRGRFKRPKVNVGVYSVIWVTRMFQPGKNSRADYQMCSISAYSSCRIGYPSSHQTAPLSLSGSPKQSKKCLGKTSRISAPPAVTATPRQINTSAPDHTLVDASAEHCTLGPSPCERSGRFVSDGALSICCIARFASRHKEDRGLAGCALRNSGPMLTIRPFTHRISFPHAIFRPCRRPSPGNPCAVFLRTVRADVLPRKIQRHRLTRRSLRSYLTEP